MNFIIRTYKESDLPHINQLFTQTVHTINTKDYAKNQLDVWAPQDRPFEHWQHIFRDSIVYVAEMDGVIVGFADLRPDGYLDHLFTHKDFQGQGIASALLQKLEEEARDLRLKELRTESSITAKPFFEKKGFVVTRKQDKPFKDMIFVNYLMKKPLRYSA